jgi:hypothetical protein
MTRIAVEPVEAKIGRLLTDEELLRLKLLDGKICFFELAVKGLREAKKSGVTDNVDTWVEAIHSAWHLLMDRGGICQHEG